jgi:hypothetical protein
MIRFRLWVPILGMFVVIMAAVCYVGFVASCYPTAHGNFIFANVPFQGPHSQGTYANHASLALIENRDLAGHRTWYYELSVSDASGQEIGSARFTPEVVGGSFSLEKEGKLAWSPDGTSLSMQIKGFGYKYYVPRAHAAS